MTDTKSNDPIGLMRLYAEVLDELNSRSIIRTYNSPVGDYAEWIVAKKLGLELEANSKKGYDAFDSKSKLRYQIKSRWERQAPCPQSRELNVIRNYDSNQFDYLIIVIFDKHFVVKEAYSIPHAVVSEYARYSTHQNGYILIAIGKVLFDERIENITGKFK